MAKPLITGKGRESLWGQQRVRGLNGHGNGSHGIPAGETGGAGDKETDYPADWGPCLGNSRAGMCACMHACGGGMPMTEWPRMAL